MATEPMGTDFKTCLIGRKRIESLYPGLHWGIRCSVGWIEKILPIVKDHLKVPCLWRSLPFLKRLGIAIGDPSDVFVCCLRAIYFGESRRYIIAILGGIFINNVISPGIKCFCQEPLKDMAGILWINDPAILSRPEKAGDIVAADHTPMGITPLLVCPVLDDGK